MTIDTGDLTTRELIIKFSERQDAIRKAVVDLQREIVKASERHATKVDLARLERDVNHLSQKFDKLGQVFVSRDEFKPIQSIVYGIISLILTAVFVALISLVVLA